MDNKMYHVCYDCSDKPHVADYKDIELCSICGFERSGFKVNRQTKDLMEYNMIQEILKRG